MLRLVIQSAFTNLARQKRVYSSLSFKNHQRQKKVGLTPAYSPSSIKDAVYNILYNTPEEDKQKPTRHVLNCLVHNEPGVLSRFSGVLASRNFNIESLVIAKTEVEDLGRMTIVLKGTDMQIEQARRQLEDLVQVWAVLDYTHTKLVERELLMIKVSILGPEHLHEQLPTAKRNDPNGESVKPNNKESAKTTLQNTCHHLRALAELTRLFHGKMVDVSSDSVIVQLSAKPERITSFMRLCKPFGIIEAARTGVMVMPRSPLHDHFGPQTKHSMSEENNETVDPTHLPPG